MRLQAMAKLKEMEAAMNEYFEARSEAAGSGLVVLPGVVELLRALQVGAGSCRSHRTPHTYRSVAASVPEMAASGGIQCFGVVQGRGDVVTCLVTGNLQPIGWGKMAALGLKDLFSQPPFGGFGSDFCSGNTGWVSQLGFPTVRRSMSAHALQYTTCGALASCRIAHVTLH
jgi:phosphoglycolate phosphatase